MRWNAVCGESRLYGVDWGKRTRFLPISIINSLRSLIDYLNLQVERAQFQYGICQVSFHIMENEYNECRSEYNACKSEFDSAKVDWDNLEYAYLTQVEDLQSNLDYCETLLNNCESTKYDRCDSCCPDGGGCFIANTQVLMADRSLKNIQDVVVGDEILAYNIDTSELESKTVLKTLVHHNTDALIEITDDYNNTLTMTPSHPILTTEGWKSRNPTTALREHGIETGWLHVGDELIGYQYNSKVTNIKEIGVGENYDTYNIAVHNFHTYITNGIIVHNADSSSESKN